MPIMEIHTIIEASLYAFQWEGDDSHCLNELTRDLTDIQFLKSFFTQRKDDLAYFKNRLPVDAAVKTLKEIRSMERELLSLANESAEYDSQGSISELFTALDNRVMTRHFIQAKAKGDAYDAPWVRIYAIQVDTDEYYITGGGIKLVEKMEDDPYLQVQLDRLQQAEDYLRKLGFI